MMRLPKFSHRVPKTIKVPALAEGGEVRNTPQGCPRGGVNLQRSKGEGVGDYGKETTKTSHIHGSIEQDDDGYYVATVPALKSCYAQAKTLDEFHERVKEVVALCLEEGEPVSMKFIGVQRLEVGA